MTCLNEIEHLRSTVAELEKALVAIRDSTYRSAVTLRGLAAEWLATFAHVSRVQSDEVTYGLALPNEIDAAIDAAMREGEG